MAVDFLESAGGSYEFDRQAGAWSQPNGSNRPHLRLYERNSLNSLQTPQSPVAGNSDFGCWSPASNPEEDGGPKPVWSNGYDGWMQNSSSENSTTSSTEDYDLDLCPNNSSNTYQPYKWTRDTCNVQRANDENLLSRMFALTLDTDEYNGQRDSGTTGRKWSHDCDSNGSYSAPNLLSNGGSYAVPKFSWDKNCPAAKYSHYAPYMQQQQSMQRVPSVPVDDCLPPQFISPTNAKWSTAQEPTPTLNATKSAPNFGYPAHQQNCNYRQRQIFAQLNAANANPHQIYQKQNMSCDEAEIQWYHRHLEFQHNMYDQIYTKVLSGELKKKQSSKPQPPQNDFHPAQVPNLDRANSIPASSSSTQSSTVALELAAKLEQCTAQYRQLEKERKKTEAELAKHHLGKKISSSNNLQIPRLPTAPSRIDRLVVDFFREHARVITLSRRMQELHGVTFDKSVDNVMRELLDAIRMLQQRRLGERNSILKHLNGDGYYDEERELSSQKEALERLTRAAVQARAANWCALIQTLGVDSDEQQMQLERILALEYQCEPPEIQARPLNMQNL